MSFFDPSPPLRVKICGITSRSDADLAIKAGADALGFNLFSGSKRFLDFEANRDWIAALAGAVERVAVVVNPTQEQLTAWREAGCFDAIQFHGDETPDFCASAGFARWIRATRVRDESDLAAALGYETPFLLFDGWADSAYGGTGVRLNWDLMREFVLKNPDRHIILAGGLTPQNVREAVRIVRPHAVDVASGVELEPRRKDEYLVREFIRAAREA